MGTEREWLEWVMERSLVHAIVRSFLIRQKIEIIKRGVLFKTPQHDHIAFQAKKRREYQL